MKITRSASIFIMIFVLFQNLRGNSFSELGIMRANIAHYCGESRWLICYERKRFPDLTETVGFDADGKIFLIRGNLRDGAENLLSLESYEKPSVTFSTKEGYLYIWNANGGQNPFESQLTVEEYSKLIKKFALYPLLKASKDGPIHFELLKTNPEFYERISQLARPKSMFHLENPTAKRVKVGIFPVKPPAEHGFIVRKVGENSAAEAAGLQAEDYVTKFVINGVIYDMEKGFPLPDEDSIRIISLKVTRRTEKEEFSFLDINIFPPSTLERFLFK